MVAKRPEQYDEIKIKIRETDPDGPQTNNCRPSACNGTQLAPEEQMAPELQYVRKSIGSGESGVLDATSSGPGDASSTTVNIENVSLICA
jgi:hypothetical protein